MRYCKSLTTFEVEGEYGRTHTIELDDGDINGQLIAVLVDKHGGDEATWAIAVDDGLITPDSLSEEDSKTLDDYCENLAMEKLYD